MNRAKSALVIPLALLAACGGGGKGGGSLPPTTNTPQTKKSGEATFSFKIPGKSTMAKLRRRYYQSQATQGVAIDWLSTNPDVPDYSAPIVAGCPPTLGDSNLPPGVTKCTVDASGDTDYQFQLNIPAGTYPDFTVTTFDTAPTLGDFTGNMLAQGQLAAPVVINAGVANSIPNLTFYGIPASVSFVPNPAQSHVVTYGGNLAIIGNAPQTFYAQAVDADGFVIDSTDSGAPTVTLAESSHDSPQHFTVATTSTPYAFTLTAIDASASATINVTATPGGTGLSPISSSVTVMPIQELWTTLEAGSNPNGIYGYPLGGPNPTQALDGYADPIGNALCGSGGGSCNFQIAGIDSSNDTIYAVGINSSSSTSIPEVFAFPLNAAGAGLIVPSSAAYVGAPNATITSMAVDAAHHGFLIDNNFGTVTLEAYSTASSAWTPITSSSSAGLTGAVAVTVAPTAPNVPSALAGTIWVGLSEGGVLVYPSFSGTLTNAPATLTGFPGGDSNEVLGFDPQGRLWSSDGNSVYVYSVSGTATSPTITELGSTALSSPGTGGTSFGAAQPDTMWFGRGDGEETGYDEYVATCSSSSCSIQVNGQQLPTNSGSFAAFVTP